VLGVSGILTLLMFIPINYLIVAASTAARSLFL
jgi:hypothetical protein